MENFAVVGEDSSTESSGVLRIFCACGMTSKSEATPRITTHASGNLPTVAAGRFHRAGFLRPRSAPSQIRPFSTCTATAGAQSLNYCFIRKDVPYCRTQPMFLGCDLSPLTVEPDTFLPRSPSGNLGRNLLIAVAEPWKFCKPHPQDTAWYGSIWPIFPGDRIVDTRWLLRDSVSSAGSKALHLGDVRE